MSRVVSSAVVAGLVFTLYGAASWGQVPSGNDKSDTHGNTGGGAGALVKVTPGSLSPTTVPTTPPTATRRSPPPPAASSTPLWGSTRSRATTPATPTLPLAPAR